MTHYQKGQDFMVQGLGPVHPATAVLHNNLEIEYVKTGTMDSALDHGARAVAILELFCASGHIDPDHHDLTQFKRDFSGILSAAGKSETEGEAVIEAAMKKLKAEQAEWELKNPETDEA